MVITQFDVQPPDSQTGPTRTALVEAGEDLHDQLHAVLAFARLPIESDVKEDCIQTAALRLLQRTDGPWTRNFVVGVLRNARRDTLRERFHLDPRGMGLAHVDPRSESDRGDSHSRLLQRMRSHLEGLLPHLTSGQRRVARCIRTGPRSLAEVRRQAGMGGEQFDRAWNGLARTLE